MRVRRICLAPTILVVCLENETQCRSFRQRHTSARGCTVLHGVRIGFLHFPTSILRALAVVRMLEWIRIIITIISSAPSATTIRMRMRRIRLAPTIAIANVFVENKTKHGFTARCNMLVHNILVETRLRTIHQSVCIGFLHFPNTILRTLSDMHKLVRRNLTQLCLLVCRVLPRSRSVRHIYCSKWRHNARYFSCSVVLHNTHCAFPLLAIRHAAPTLRNVFCHVERLITTTSNHRTFSSSSWVPTNICPPLIRSILQLHKTSTRLVYIINHLKYRVDRGTRTSRNTIGNNTLVHIIF